MENHLLHPVCTLSDLNSSPPCQPPGSLPTPSLRRMEPNVPTDLPCCPLRSLHIQVHAHAEGMQLSMQCGRSSPCVWWSSGFAKFCNRGFWKYQTTQRFPLSCSLLCATWTHSLLEQEWYYYYGIHSSRFIAGFGHFLWGGLEVGYCRWPGGLRDNECLSGNEDLGLGQERCWMLKTGRELVRRWWLESSRMFCHSLMNPPLPENMKKSQNQRLGKLDVQMDFTLNVNTAA